MWPVGPANTFHTRVASCALNPFSDSEKHEQSAHGSDNDECYHGGECHAADTADTILRSCTRSDGTTHALTPSHCACTDILICAYMFISYLHLHKPIHQNLHMCGVRSSPAPMHRQRVKAACLPRSLNGFAKPPTTRPSWTRFVCISERICSYAKVEVCFYECCMG